jgi:hypothetical protein
VRSLERPLLPAEEHVGPKFQVGAGDGGEVEGLGDDFNAS